MVVMVVAVVVHLVQELPVLVHKGLVAETVKQTPNGVAVAVAAWAPLVVLVVLQQAVLVVLEQIHTQLGQLLQHQALVVI
jgi:hypothetical protein